MGVIIGSVGNLLKISQKNTQNEKTVDPVYGMDVTVETTNQFSLAGIESRCCGGAASGRSYHHILVLKKEFDIKTLLVYLATIGVSALFLSYFFR